MQVEDTNDPAILLKDCQPAFIECERTYIEIMNLHDFDEREDERAFENEVIRKIPLHVQKYMEVNNIFACDLDETQYENKRATDVKIQ